jgi:hypothetical protein
MLPPEPGTKSAWAETSVRLAAVNMRPVKRAIRETEE